MEAACTLAPKAVLKRLAATVKVSAAAVTLGSLDFFVILTSLLCLFLPYIVKNKQTDLIRILSNLNVM
jgi:hypothetical protein